MVLFKKTKLKYLIEITFERNLNCQKHVTILPTSAARKPGFLSRCFSEKILSFNSICPSCCSLKSNKEFLPFAVINRVSKRWNELPADFFLFTQKNIWIFSISFVDSVNLVHPIKLIRAENITSHGHWISKTFTKHFTMFLKLLLYYLKFLS